MPSDFATSMPSSTDTLDGIQRAFFATLNRDGGPVFEVLALALLIAVGFALVRWLRREVRRERAEQVARSARHEAALSDLKGAAERREWVRVPAHLHMSLQHTGSRQRFFYEDCETLGLSGGSLAFSTRVPTTPGAPLYFTLDVGERRPLPLHGVVVRVEPPPAPGAASVVVAKLEPVTMQEREHVVRWVSRQESLGLVQAHRGKLCSYCGRPLANDTDDMHPTCAASKVPPQRNATVAPS